MKKICLISPGAFPLLKDLDELSFGGAELQFKILGSELSKRDFEVHFVVDDFGQPDFVYINGMHVHKLAFRYLSGSKWYAFQDWCRFILILWKIDAALYFLKTPRHLLGPMALFGMIFRKKIVFVGQSDSDVNRDLLKLEGKISYLLYNLGMLGVDKVVAQNRFQLQGFVRNYKKRTYLIKNIAFLENYKEVPKKKFVLWVGNNSPNKQADKFLKLAECLPQYEFKMILSVTQKYPSDQNITNASAKLKNFEYLGCVPFKKIHVYFEEASLFVSTSLREGFPNTFLQAWKCRTPVVSLHVDPDEVIKRYGLGSISGCFEDFCEDVDLLMQNSILNQQIGNKCFDYVNVHHSVNSIMMQYTNILR